jgi:tRNA threonylcarbamoyladenosine biosynthesis protein TsaB
MLLPCRDPIWLSLTRHLPPNHAVHILALETSGRDASVALLERRGDAVEPLIQRTLPDGERSAKSLLPCVAEALREASWRPADLELIAVTTGPGSFTGLRIGVVAAKTLAYATGAKLIGVHTLTAVAAGVQCNAPRLWVLLDAQRHEFFAASFDMRLPLAQQLDPETHVLGFDPWLALVNPGDAVAGPPITKIRERLPVDLTIADVPTSLPRAVDVGQLAVAHFDHGDIVDPLALTPRYFRKSAAEEKAARFV